MRNETMTKAFNRVVTNGLMNYFDASLIEKMMGQIINNDAISASEIKAFVKARLDELQEATVDYSYNNAV